MRKILLGTLLVLMVAMFAVGLLPSTSSAEFHIILDEHFNRDPERNSWPWDTPGPRGTRYSWYHNVRNWNIDNPRVLQPFTECGWGWQDEIYCSRVFQNEDYPGSLWCAYRTNEGPDNPQWPDEDVYWRDMNAWAVWGPFDLREAVGGMVLFYVKIELDNVCGDSLSVVIVDEDRNLLLDGAAFRSRCGIGKTFPIRTDNWVQRYVYFDSLYVNGELTSCLGERRCWLCFVWHSDRNYIAGTGAFIDDIIVVWDDGFFDIRPMEMKFGYAVNDTLIEWMRDQPVLYDEVYFKVNYKVTGSEDYTPPFDINFLIDDEVFYTEHIDSLQGTEDSLHTAVTDTFWLAARGEHLFRWELDVPLEDEGNVEEASEENNDIERLVDVEWDPAPQFEILTPAEGINEAMLLVPYDITWAVSDSNEHDSLFTVYLYWTTDTSGWAEDHTVIFEEEPPWTMFEGRAGFATGGHTSPLTLVDTSLVGDTVFVAGFCRDNNPNNTVHSIAVGSLRVIPYNTAPVVSAKEVSDFSIRSAYPNPFNRAISIDYALPTAGLTKLSAFDLSGRKIATLIEGFVTGGSHTFSWQPSAIPGGIYLLRLETEGMVHQRKVVYIP